MNPGRSPSAKRLTITITITGSVTPGMLYSLDPTTDICTAVDPVSLSNRTLLELGDPFDPEELVRAERVMRD